jgi:ankyrin repeat protein
MAGSTAGECPPPAPNRRLLRCGADVNAGDYDARTALHVAAADGNLAAVKLLVEQGRADLDVQDRWAKGRQPLPGAVSQAHKM